RRGGRSGDAPLRTGTVPPARRRPAGLRGRTDPAARAHRSRPAVRPSHRRHGPDPHPVRAAGGSPDGRTFGMISRRNLLASLPLAAAGLAGAGARPSGGGTASPSAGGTASALSWMSVVPTPTPPDAAGPVETGLKERTASSFSYQWVPDASKEEKINAALASGSVADITTLNQLVMPSIRSALTSGLFWDVEEHMAQLPTLSHINADVIAGARVDGGLYGIPFQQSLARYGVLVRQDWLDRLGLEVPHTI